MTIIENFSIINLHEFLASHKKFDTFIGGVSFEERSLRVSQILFENKAVIKNSILLNYLDFSNKSIIVNKNLIEIEKNLNQISKNLINFDFKHVNKPSEGIKAFCNFIKEKEITFRNDEVIIDISVLTIPYYFLFLKILLEVFNITVLYITYTEPAAYGNNKNNTYEIALTEGLDKVELIPGFFGTSVNNKNALITLIGYEGKRSFDVYRDVEPDITFAINGFPSFQPGMDRVSLIANLDFLRESGASDYLGFAPANNPFETARAISKLRKNIDNLEDKFNIVIAPLGTKLQALGALLYTLKNDGIKVIYPFPSTYNIDYSISFRKTWILKINLKNLDYINSNLFI